MVWMRCTTSPILAAGSLAARAQSAASTRVVTGRIRKPSVICFLLGCRIASCRAGAACRGAARGERMAAIIRPFVESEAAAFRDIRLEALRLEPAAFGASYEEARATDVAAFAAGLPKRAPDAVFGAWLPGEAVPQGMAGVFAHRPRKVAHKGAIWGV